ncbi:MAG: HAD family acid phosphatase [Terracidiphilus sp.]|nr:HAD family acid phosphatase [Terracidiphilus sp.]
MKKNSVFLAAIFALAFVPALLPAQQPSALPAAKVGALAPGERIANLGTLKAQLRKYHECTCTCGCYTRDLDLQADRAIAFLRQRAAHRRPQEKLALILDIDETSLSNYQEMTKADFTYDSKTFNAWVDTAQAPAIAGTLRLTREAQRLGVSVFFLTGRPKAQRDVTERNLRAQGFQNWQQLILRSPAQASATALAYKSVARAGIAAQGYSLVLNVGDQWSDLKGNPEAEFSIKYPDPYYFIP